MKVGDKVILKSFNKNPNLDWQPELGLFVGKEVTVERIDSDGTFRIKELKEIIDSEIAWWLQSACEVVPSEPVKNERYFLFAYSSENNNGNITLITNDGKMPKAKTIEGIIKDELKTKTAAITNIFEFKSKQDYLDFTSNE